MYFDNARQAMQWPVGEELGRPVFLDWSDDEGVFGVGYVSDPSSRIEIKARTFKERPSPLERMRWEGKDLLQGSG
jgi:hypothetical protein